MAACQYPENYGFAVSQEASPSGGHGTDRQRLSWSIINPTFLSPWIFYLPLCGEGRFGHAITLNDPLGMQFASCWWHGIPHVPFLVTWLWESSVLPCLHTQRILETGNISNYWVSRWKLNQNSTTAGFALPAWLAPWVEGWPALAGSASLQTSPGDLSERWFTSWRENPFIYL